MQFAGFTFIVTDSCNFRCSYCRQKKEKKYLNIATIEKAIDFFFPILKEECYINFYGGEPLLAFEQIKQAVQSIQSKNKELNKEILYSMSTNGSLVDDEVIQFLDQNGFSLLLSFDGFAQDISRRKGSYEHVVSTIENLLRYPNIRLLINSVFAPDTVEYLSDSMKFIIEMGIPNINLSLSTFPPWESSSLLKLKKELTSLREFSLSLYRRINMAPLNYLEKSSRKGLFGCLAGKDRMTLAPNGKLWGCHLLPNYFKGKEKLKEYSIYSFGDLKSFIENHEEIYPEIISNYTNLRMDNFFTSDTWCMLCKDLGQCSVCPFDAAFSSLMIGKIPCWICEIKKIFRNENALFWKELENRN